VHRKDEGKPTWKVRQNANRESCASKLCRWVVPVRGCPRMKMGSACSGVALMASAYSHLCRGRWRWGWG
jgi:hypothetical protein